MIEEGLWGCIMKRRLLATQLLFERAKRITKNKFTPLIYLTSSSFTYSVTIINSSRLTAVTITYPIEDSTIHSTTCLKLIMKISLRDIYSSVSAMKPRLINTEIPYPQNTLWGNSPWIGVSFYMLCLPSEWLGGNKNWPIAHQSPGIFVKTPIYWLIHHQIFPARYIQWIPVICCIQNQ